MNYEARIEAPGEEEPGLDADTASAARRRRWLIAAGVFVALAALYWLFHRGDADSSKAVQQAATVSVIMPGRATIASAISATGTIAARREMPVGSVGEGGQVSEVRVDAEPVDVGEGLVDEAQLAEVLGLEDGVGDRAAHVGARWAQGEVSA